MMTLTGRLLLTLHAEVGRGIGCGEAEGNRRRSPFRSLGAETLIPNNMLSRARESLGIAWISRGHHDDALVVRIPMSALGRIPDL